MDKLIKKIKHFLHWLIAFFAYWYYGRPSRKLVVVGITGTKGKTTTSRLVASVLEKAGFKTGLLSTVEFQIGDVRVQNDKKMTMLGKGQIQKMLKQMVGAGCTHVVVETSSEGILQFRHYGLNYDVCVFTNLGSEHAERHGGYDKLRSDKGKIFSSLAGSYQKVINGKKISKIIIANGDDKEAGYYLSFKADKKISFGFNNIYGKKFDCIFAEKVSDERTFVVNGEKYQLGLIGDFNIYNGLAAFAVGQALGIQNELIKDALFSVKLVPGRMEFIDGKQPFKVVVDYAHEPLSLEALFKSLRKMTDKKIIGVIGSDGGGRDKQKRSKMGAISGLLADIVVITDVNCYDEDPMVIAEMLAKGARESGKKDGEDLFVEIDRKNAIKKAFELAEANDIVVITAKGTEPYIGVAKGNKIPWDDRKVSKELIDQIYV